MSWEDVGDVLLRLGFGRNSSRAYAASSPPRPPRSSQRYEGRHSLKPRTPSAQNHKYSVPELAIAEVETTHHSSAKAAHRVSSSDELIIHLSKFSKEDDEQILCEESSNSRGYNKEGDEDVSSQEDGRSGKDRASSHDVEEEGAISAQEDSQSDEASHDVEEEAAISDTNNEQEGTGVANMPQDGALDENAEGDDLTKKEDIGGLQQITDGLNQQKIPPIYDHPPSVLAATVSSVDAVNTAAESIAVRSEVESTLTSMLADIETCHSLSTELRQHSAIARLENELKVARRALEELSASNDAKSKRRAQLGDRFVQELVRLSSQLSDLEHWREANEKKVCRYEVVRRELEICQKRVGETATFCKESYVKNSDGQATKLKACATADEGMTSNSIPRTEPTPSSSMERNEDRGEPSSGAVVAATSTGDDEVQRISSKEQSQYLQVQEGTPSLQILPEPAILCIFSYLKAQDILSVAEVSITLYSRVDSLFGLGSGDNGHEEDATDMVAPKKEEISAMRAPKDHPAQASPTIASISLLPSADQSSNVFSKIWSSTAESSQSQHGRKPSIGGDNIASAGTAAKSVAVDLSPAAASSAVVLTSGMASNVAAKLAPAELAVIISMREKLHNKDDEVRKLQQEKSDIMAELRGIESVKDFLVSKLRDAERLHAVSESDAARVARQAASDQEVIAFLDCRVQELERGIGVLESANRRAGEEMKLLQTKGREKVCILEDMLKFERDRLESSEREWKVTKKVLVKEVKHCRRQILSLEAERDGLEEQNAKLKDALLARCGGSPVLERIR